MMFPLCCLIATMSWKVANNATRRHSEHAHVGRRELLNTSGIWSSHAQTLGGRGEGEPSAAGGGGSLAEVGAREGGGRRRTRMVFAGTPSTVDKHSLESNRECQRATWGSQVEHFLFLNESDWVEDLHPGNWNIMAMLLQRAVALGDWEWLIRGDELSYILPHNMRNYLSGFDSKSPIVLGNTLSRGRGKAPFASSGSGIVMSRTAVEMLLNGTCDSEAREHPEQADFMSDVLVGEYCYGALVGRPGAFLPDTRAPDGERFNVYGPVRSTRAELDDWYVEYKSNHGQVPVKGAACCSAKSVSFYYIDHHECWAMWSVGRDIKRWRAMDHRKRVQGWPEGVFGYVFQLPTFPLTSGSSHASD